MNDEILFTLPHFQIEEGLFNSSAEYPFSQEDLILGEWQQFHYLGKGSQFTVRV